MDGTFSELGTSSETKVSGPSAVVGLIDRDGGVQWSTLVTGLQEGSHRLPLAVQCAGSPSSCNVLLTGPSTATTASGTVKIDDWTGYVSFLAAFDLSTGKVAILPLFSPLLGVV